MSIAALSSQGFLHARARAISRNNIESHALAATISPIPSKKSAAANRLMPQAIIAEEQQKPIQPINYPENFAQKYDATLASKIELERYHPQAQVAISSYKKNENFNKLEEIQQMLGVDLYV